MALNDYPVLIDLSTGETVQDFFTNIGAELPPIKQGDSLRLLVSAVVRNPNANADISRPWKYVNLPENLRAGVGVVGATPETGTFTLTYGANTTSALAYNATAAQVAAALNALASITSDGGVSVSGEDGGPYRVVFTNNGSRTAISGNGDLLYPVTSINVVESRAGTASIPEIQTIILERQADAYTETFTDFPAAAVGISTLQEGATDVPDVQQITLDPPPHGGTFTLTFDGETTVAIAYDATAEAVQEALEGLGGIAADGADITVTGVSPTWQVSFHGALVGDQPEMTGSATGLEVAKGKIGVLDLNTDGIATLVGAGTTTVSLEIESTDEPVTLLQQEVELINDLIPNSPVGSTPLPQYMQKSVYDPQNVSHISGADGQDASGSGGTGGALYMDGGDASGAQSGGNAGTITMNGADAATAAGGSAGSINTSGGNPSGATPGNDGGSINTSGGTTGDGGSINTSNGGGSIDTTGTGDIELGVNGTRTHLQGSATSNRFVTLPDQTCTLAAAGAVGSSGLTMATARLLGRTTASTGAVEEITIGSGLSLSGGQISVSGGTGATLGANTFTRLQTITQGTANEGIIASTGHSLTGANAQNMVDLAGTWNTTGVPTAIKLNITNTASGVGSKLLDLQVGGSSKFNVDTDGYLTFPFTGDFVRFLKAGASSGGGPFQMMYFVTQTPISFSSSEEGCVPWMARWASVQRMPH
jgi:hypothetical protein